MHPDVTDQLHRHRLRRRHRRPPSPAPCDLGLSSRALTDDEKSQGRRGEHRGPGRRGRGCQPREHRDRPDHASRSPRSSPARSPTGPSWAAPTPRSPSSAVTPPPAPAAPSRRSSALRMPVRLHQRVLLHRRRHRQRGLQPQRHRLRLPLRRGRHRGGRERQRRDPHRGHRGGRHLSRSSAPSSWSPWRAPSSAAAAQAFLDYAMSADVADIIAAAGAVVRQRLSHTSKSRQRPPHPGACCLDMRVCI